jgi:hypothetical protein
MKLRLLVNGAGDLTDFVGYPSGTPQAAVVVNDGDTLYARNPAGEQGTKQQLFTFEDIAGRITDEATINYVDFLYVARVGEAAPSRQLFPLAKEGGTLTKAATPFDLTGSWVAYSYHMTTNPRTGTAWTKAQIDSLQGGMETYLSGGGCSNDTVVRRITYLAAEVDFSEPSRTVEQNHFRFFRDAGALNSADPQADENESLLAFPTGRNLRIRFASVSTGAAYVAVKRRLQYRINSLIWEDVLTSAGPVRLVDSSQFSDGAATTKRLSGAETFTAGQGKDTGNETTELQINAGYQTEDEFCIKFWPEAAGYEVELRVTDEGFGFDSYGANASIFVVPAYTRQILSVRKIGFTNGLIPTEHLTTLNLSGAKFLNNWNAWLWVRTPTACNITIVSQIEPESLETEDQIIAMGAGEIRILGPYPPAVFNDQKGYTILDCDCEAEDAEIVAFTFDMEE